jgi:hypothetical protein
MPFSLSAAFDTKSNLQTPDTYKLLVPKTEDVLRKEGKTPHILNVYMIWRWAISFTHRPFTPGGKSPL